MCKSSVWDSCCQHANCTCRITVFSHVALLICVTGRALRRVQTLNKVYVRTWSLTPYLFLDTVLHRYIQICKSFTQIQSNVVLLWIVAWCPDPRPIGYYGSLCCSLWLILAWGFESLLGSVTNLCQQGKPPPRKFRGQLQCSWPLCCGQSAVANLVRNFLEL